ncbi:TPA: hypothetical protein NEG48_003795, partial [Elizabethkingia anophelis]|nr:hypothetical protein [Elizabethkingia anophelis]
MKNKQITIQLIALLLYTFINSCRSTDTENTITRLGASAVSFNILDTEYANSGKLARHASLAKGNIIYSENGVQRQSLLINPSNVISVELSPSSDNSKILANATSGKNSLAVVPGTTLTSGIMFRVIAY